MSRDADGWNRNEYVWIDHDPQWTQLQEAIYESKRCIVDGCPEKAPHSFVYVGDGKVHHLVTSPAGLAVKG